LADENTPFRAKGQAEAGAIPARRRAAVPGQQSALWVSGSARCGLRPLRRGGFGKWQHPTARNAVASTFGLTGAEYGPQVET